MNIINQHIPRTISHSNAESKDNDRAKVERDILEFEANGGGIQYIDRGVGRFRFINGKKLLQSMSSANTLSNQENKKRRLSVKC